MPRSSGINGLSDADISVPRWDKMKVNGQYLIPYSYDKMHPTSFKIIEEGMRNLEIGTCLKFVKKNDYLKAGSSKKI